MKNIMLLAALGSLTIGTLSYGRCKPEELSLKFPMRGNEGLDWVINNYVDLDTASGSMRDYKNNTGADAKTYDNHNGIDIDTSTFRQMDDGTNIFASAAGTVISVQEDLFDRNYVGAPGCGAWNHVAIQHDNGFVSYYGHMKKDSVRVKVGDVVAQGKPLGLVGSSGCSSTAHLHFELKCDGVVVDPFLNGMFVNPPAYDPPYRLMDMIVRKGGFPDVNNDALMKGPNPNITSIMPNSRIGIGLSTSGGRVGDRLDVQIRRADGSIATQFDSFTLNREGRHGFPRWWVTLPATGSGQWWAQVNINGSEVGRRTFTVENNNLNITYAMPDVAYQAQFQSLVDDSYRTLQIDGSSSPEGARISAVHRRDGVGVRAFHNLDNAGFAALYRAETARGNQLMSIDSYVRNGQLNVAGYFQPRVSRSWRVEHFLKQEDHQRIFNEVTRAGMVPYAISVSVLNGVHYYTSAYGERSTAGFFANADITAATYQQFFNENKARGMGLAYLDVYDNGQGTPLFSAIWTRETDHNRQQVRHDMTQAAFNTLTDQLFQQGYRLSHITSYLKGGNRMYAGIWTR